MSTERDSTGAAVVVDPLGGLLLDPSNELRFKGPFDDYVTVSLSIKNPTAKRIAFKIKTTAPKRYCVKPNSGVLDPTQSMKVNVLLQPFVYDPSEKNKHKFMVQYLYLNDEEMQLSVNDILNMWKDFPTTRLLDLKLKCLFEFSENENQKIQQAQQQASSNDANRQTVQDATNKIKPSATNPPNSQTTSSSSSSSNTLKSNTSSVAPARGNTSDVFAPASDSTTYDFDSTANTTVLNTNKLPNNTNSGAAQTRVEKNDNTLNELKLARQENELLKKEINRLKEEESRLRKMVLQPSSASSSSTNRNLANANTSLEFNSFADILNNRLVVIIMILFAIIVYLLLFR